MKKEILYTFLLVFSAFFNAQIGIGTQSPNASAILDVNSTNKGFLLPRVNLTGTTDVATIATPALGLMAYNKTAAGTSPNNVLGNYIYLWRGSSWDRFTNLSEIKTLKVPYDFAWVSKTQQIWTATELTTINSTSVGVVPVTWNNPTDVLVANPTDLATEGTSNLRFLTAGNYTISGSFIVRINVATAGSPSNMVATIQKSTNNGSTWTDIAASALPFETYATGRSQTMVFPSIVHNFSANNLMRFVISRPGSGVTTQTPAAYITDSGIRSNATDVIKSFKITRLKE